MKTIHVVLNSHIDPIWLWPWQSGLDTILNTCRSVCDLLDRNPDAVFTSGEAWKYFQVQRCDPALFERIRTHVRAGRWEIVGWWIQPDCNFPSSWAMKKQIQLAQQYFQKEFGSSPRVGYNVDSFGHAAALPGLMREAGQDCYVMMRPQEHERELPARLFRWRGYDGGPEVTTFRIAKSYGEFGKREERVAAALEAIPAGVEHTMLFLGVGDHGGGPSQELLEWVRANAQTAAGAQLVFSSPARFFAAVAGDHAKLPLVTGELQMHAVGCYSAYRPIKLGLRRVEHLLHRAESIATAEQSPGIDDLWKTVCFHHFHDTLGGTCTPTAYVMPDAQLGGALAAADDILQVSLRQFMTTVPPDKLQRVVFWNASDTTFSSYVWYDPWIEGQSWFPDWRVLDEAGREVPVQQVQPEAASDWIHRLLLRVELPPGGRAVWRVEPRKGEAIRNAITASAVGVRHADGSGVRLGEALEIAGKHFVLPHLELLDDLTDTWSHDADRYGEGPGQQPLWADAMALDSGPLMGSVIRAGKIGASLVQEEWRVYERETFVELVLRITWHERHKVLKLVWPFETPATARVDGIMGGSLTRALDGLERPVRDFVRLDLGGATAVGVVCPDVFAADALPARLRLTLLRSPVMAHHAPRVATTVPRARAADQGSHEFVFRFFAGAPVETLDAQAMMLQRPPIIGEWTAGMPR